MHNLRSIYVHFPWCLSKCPYCDFNSYSISSFDNNNLLSSYTERMLFDLKIESKNLSDTHISSIYFGGGTPSIMSPKLIYMLISTINKFFILNNNIEITLEANPGTINKKKCQDFKSSGINRISLGVQSFDDFYLKSIGRIHNKKQALQAVCAIQNAGFKNFNIDLMFGLPGQSIKNALNDLKTACDFKPAHISWYQLTIEPNTGFFISPPKLPEQDEIWKMQQTGQRNLNESGYKQYEISAYSIFGSDCVHNVNYWQFGDYIGIGAGAHGKITSQNTIKRYVKKTDPKQYLTSNNLLEEEETISSDRVQFEFMLNNLRLFRPISYQAFYDCTGIKITSVMPKLQESEKLGLLELHDNFFVSTTRGRNFLNDLLEIFIL